MTHSLARALWSGELAVGGTAEVVSGPFFRNIRHLEVVGIVPDLAQYSIRTGLRDGVIQASSLRVTEFDPLFFGCGSDCDHRCAGNTVRAAGGNREH